MPEITNSAVVQALATAIVGDETAKQIMVDGGLGSPDPSGHALGEVLTIKAGNTESFSQLDKVSALLIDGWTAEHNYPNPFIGDDEYVVILLRPAGSASLFICEVSGDTGAVEPDWDGDAPNVGDSLVDGDNTWYNLGLAADFDPVPVPFAVDTVYPPGTLLTPSIPNGHIYIVAPGYGDFTASAEPTWNTDGSYLAVGAGYAYDEGAKLVGSYAATPVSAEQVAIPATFDDVGLQAAIDTGSPVVLLRPGTYVLADGVSITLRGDQTIRGAGPARTVISSKDAYAFVTPVTGSCDRVTIKDLGFLLRTGSASGGAIKALSDSYHAGWLLANVYADGRTGVSDPLFYLDGWINSYADMVQAQTAQIGIQLSSDGFASNASQLRNCRVTGCTVYGFYLKGGGGSRVLGGIAEGNTGIGVRVDAAAATEITGVWFENTAGHVSITGTATSTRIRDNFFQDHPGGSSKPHVELVGPESPSVLGGVIIDGNRFSNPSGSGDQVSIDENCSGTILSNNNWYGAAPYVADEGKGTLMLNNSTGDNYPTPNRIGGPVEAGYRPYYDTQYPTIWGKRRADQNSDLFHLEDEDGNPLASIPSTGLKAASGQTYKVVVDDQGVMSAVADA